MKTPLLTGLCAAILAVSACAPSAPSAPSAPAATEAPALGSAATVESGQADGLETYSALVSAAHPLAAEAGKEMLRQGGSAADAALATLVALTVVEPQSSGIGGGGFLIYHDAESGRTFALDGRETAPEAARPDMFVDENGEALPYRASQVGGKSVGVPGNVRLMQKLHRRFGKLPWARLFDPAIRLAEEGWEVTPRLHEMLTRSQERASLTPWARATFFTAANEPKPVGTRLTNPALANFLRHLQAEGPNAFYSGRPASLLVQAVVTAPVNAQRMTTADLSNYEAKWREPVCGDYRGYRVCGMPPPSSGGTTVLAILKQLERFDLAAMGPDSPKSWHLIAESMRLAFADREKYVGDPDFVSVPTAGLVADGYTTSRGQLIDPARAAESVEAGTPPGAGDMAFHVQPPDGGTSHFVAADRDGDVASLTSTIESVWGSGLTVNGYFLNNELTDFSFLPTKDGRPVANAVAAGKRPRSSMAPTIVYAPSGEVAFAIGAAGGPTIIAQTAKAIIGVVDWDMSIDEAIDAPQLYAALGPVVLEEGSEVAAYADTLSEMGHQVATSSLPLKANGLARRGRGWVGGADGRGEGAVRGLR
ncbi:gamma-glutamyltransferase [Pacificimonas flava]|uniref:Glutathione hydrolase proenzyme n=2 Tax=Pacificimonas TaxID=1960290 RepID=A0A219B2L2_9SPHN|nr:MULTISPECIES: gamma-glutamyltransferase [Pacificimonas]MBZ6377735.1 gamma-glutamyltransferase [Pacificimonas aurantium]OWV32587.1 gamma-glutamyltransferase [Pacificimonas flava]